MSRQETVDHATWTEAELNGLAAPVTSGGSGIGLVAARLGRPATRPGHRPRRRRAALEARQPMGRLVCAEEVAVAIAYLAGPGAAPVTGTALAVDGGMAGLRLRPRQ